MKCEKCDKEFGSKNSYDQHNAVKHPVQKSSFYLNSKTKKRIKFWGIFSVFLILIIFGGYFIFHKSQNIDVLAMNLLSHNNVALHAHSNIEIEIMGEKQQIPANIGISHEGVMRVVHTHDSTGTLHVEPPIPTDLSLGNFFTIWNKKFNSQCIFNNCVDENHVLEVFVNDQLNFEYENLILKDEDKIKIVYRINN